MTSSRAPRLSGDARRASIVDAATRVFARLGYLGATTAAIAREVNVNEALLFRHFGSKQGLYLACIDAAWQHVRDRCELAFANEPQESQHWKSLGRTFLGVAEREPHIARVWLQSLSDTTGVEAIERHVSTVMSTAHQYAQRAIERSQAAGGVRPQLDPRSEAWIIIALGMLHTAGARLGNVVQRDMPDVLASHREWRSGSREP
jgi:AcrR family transcriptional regulator